MVTPHSSSLDVRIGVGVREKASVEGVSVGAGELVVESKQAK